MYKMLKLMLIAQELCSNDWIGSIYLSTVPKNSGREKLHVSG